jgi:hypothetical protein
VPISKQPMMMRYRNIEILISHGDYSIQGFFYFYRRFIEKNYVLDSVVIKMPKTYPAYFGTYDKFDVITNFTNKIENLFLIGRNGMHRYNNQDHSMLTAITAVQNIITNRKDKSNIWSVNTENEYHEKK